MGSSTCRLKSNLHYSIRSLTTYLSMNARSRLRLATKVFRLDGQSLGPISAFYLTSLRLKLDCGLFSLFPMHSTIPPLVLILKQAHSRIRLVWHPNTSHMIRNCPRLFLWLGETLIASLDLYDGRIFPLSNLCPQLYWQFLCLESLVPLILLILCGIFS